MRFKFIIILILTLSIQGCSKASDITKGEDLLIDKKFQEAEEYFSNLISKKEKIADSYYYRSQAKRHLGKIDEAFSDCEALELIEGESARKLECKASTLFILENRHLNWKQEIIDLCTQAIHLDKKFIPAYECLYKIYEFENKDLQLYWIEEGLKHLVNNLTLLNLKNNILLSQKKYSESIKLIQNTLKLKNKNAYEISELMLRTSIFNATLTKDYTEILDFSEMLDYTQKQYNSPRGTSPYVEKAKALFYLGLYEKALAYIDQNLSNENGIHLANLYEIRSRLLITFDKNRRIESLKNIESSIQIDPKHSRYFTKALIESLSGNFSSCVESIQKAIELLDKNSYDYLNKTEKEYYELKDDCIKLKSIKRK
jgi:hypothetical protein